MMPHNMKQYQCCPQYMWLESPPSVQHGHLLPSVTGPRFTGYYRARVTGYYWATVTGYYRTRIIGYYRARVIGYCRARVTGYYRAGVTGYCGARVTGYYRPRVTGYCRARVTGYYRPTLRAQDWLRLRIQLLLYHSQGPLGKDYFRTTIFFPANFVTLLAVIWLDGEHYFSAGTYTPNNIKL